MGLLAEVQVREGGGWSIGGGGAAGRVATQVDRASVCALDAPGGASSPQRRHDSSADYLLVPSRCRHERLGASPLPRVPAGRAPAAQTAQI